MFIYITAPNPKYCIAVQVRHNDNKVISSVRSCNQTLHAICISLPGKFDGTDNKKSTNGNIHYKVSNNCENILSNSKNLVTKCQWNDKQKK